MKSHICTKEELGVTEDRSKSRFLPHTDQGKGLVELYQKKMLCVDDDELFVYGDWDSLSTRQINI